MANADQSICVCGTQGVVTDIGSASGRRYFQCPTCSAKWREKNPAAVALGKLGAEAANAKRTPEEREALAKEAADERWRQEKIKRRLAAGVQ